MNKAYANKLYSYLHLGYHSKEDVINEILATCNQNIPGFKATVPADTQVSPAVRNIYHSYDYDMFKDDYNRAPLEITRWNPKYVPAPMVECFGIKGKEIPELPRLLEAYFEFSGLYGGSCKELTVEWFVSAILRVREIIAGSIVLPDCSAEVGEATQIYVIGNAFAHKNPDRRVTWQCAMNRLLSQYTARPVDLVLLSYTPLTQCIDAELEVIENSVLLNNVEQYCMNITTFDSYVKRIAYEIMESVEDCDAAKKISHKELLDTCTGCARELCHNGLSQYAKDYFSNSYHDYPVASDSARRAVAKLKGQVMPSYTPFTKWIEEGNF